MVETIIINPKMASFTRSAKGKKLESVILIDNNETDNFINKKILERFGVSNILVFTSTVTALKYFQETKIAPQVILLDIDFPLIDGFEFLEKFKKLEIAKHPIDIVILTVTINPAEREKIKSCAGFIEKPLTIENLFKQTSFNK